MLLNNSDPGLIRLHNEIQMFCDEKGLKIKQLKLTEGEIDLEIIDIDTELLQELQQRLINL